MSFAESVRSRRGAGSVGAGRDGAPDDAGQRAAGVRAEQRAAGVRAEHLRAAMGRFATGVTVITTRDRAGRPFGTTANAVSSVSLSPPLVLACLREQSQTLAALLDRRRFAINVLESSQTELSDRFARPAHAGTWDAVAHRIVGDIPVLEGAIATLQCDLHDVADGGDHSVVVGHVIELQQAGPDDAEPLLFYGGSYRSLGAPPRPPAMPEPAEITVPSRHGALRAISLADDELHTSVAVLTGELHGRRGVLVYAHTPCVLGDALGSTACPGHGRLEAALARMRDEGCGVAVYHRDHDARSPFGACCAAGAREVAPLSAGAIEALARAVTIVGCSAIRLVATVADGRAAARAGVPIGELIDPVGG